MSFRALSALVVTVAGIGCLIGCTPEQIATDSGSVAVVEQHTAPAYAGVWEPVSVKTDGVVSTEADVLLNYDYRFALYEDGTAELHLLGVDVRSNYELDGDKIVFFDSEASYVNLAMDGDDALVLTEGVTGTSVTFARVESA